MNKLSESLILSSYIQKNSRLTDLMKQFRQADAEQDQLASLLPVAFRDRVRVRRHQDQLTLVAENNAVAQMLRFQGQALLNATGCDRLKIRVAALNPIDREHEAATLPNVNRSMSRQTSQLLQETADDIADPALASALRQLADNH